MTVPSSGGASIRSLGSKRRLFRTRYILQRAWGRVRWRMVAIIAFTGASTVLVACLGIAVLNVSVRRESANVVQKQVQVLVQASRSVAPAILDHAGACDAQPADSGGLRPLLAYTDQAFPQAQTYLAVEDARGVQSLLPGTDPAGVKQPGWLSQTQFAGLVEDGGQLEIRNVVVQKKGRCKVTAIFSLPLGARVGKATLFRGQYGGNGRLPTADPCALFEPVDAQNHGTKLPAWHVPVGERGADRS